MESCTTEEMIRNSENKETDVTVSNKNGKYPSPFIRF